jgi:hypothetical protein
MNVIDSFLRLQEDIEEEIELDLMEFEEDFPDAYEELQLYCTAILLQERDKDIQHPCVEEVSKDRSGLQRSDNKERCDLLYKRIREKDMGTLRTFLQ